MNNIEEMNGIDFYKYLCENKYEVTLSLKDLPRSIRAGAESIDNPLENNIVSGVIDKVYPNLGLYGMLYFTYEASNGKQTHLYLDISHIVAIAFQDA